jgi:hypothetical protein
MRLLLQVQSLRATGQHPNEKTLSLKKKTNHSIHKKPIRDRNDSRSQFIGGDKKSHQTFPQTCAGGTRLRTNTHAPLHNR